MPKVLVTGASGLIGSRIVAMLRDSDVPLIATTRQPTSRLSRELNVEVLPLDVLAPPGSEWQGGNADCLIHCATANDILSKQVSLGMELSVSGTWNVLEFARSIGVSRVIFFSTFQVYGTELSGTIDEATRPRCETAYGLNHWFGEEVCRLFAQQYHLSVAVVRPSNVYGVPVASTVNRETLVPTCFVRAALAQQKLALHSSGRQQRNFVSTDEVANACMALLGDSTPGFEIYNVCSAYNGTIRDIAELTADVYRDRFARPLPIYIGSDMPERSNLFTAESRLRHLWSTSEQSRHRLRLAISQLFDFLEDADKEVAGHSIYGELKYGSRC